MMKPRRLPSVLAMLTIVSLLVAARPALADPQPVRVVCGGFHFIRLGLEIGTTAVNFRNADTENAATIERFTIRDSAGEVVWDSGPVIGTPHPLNTDYVPPRAFTTVPPGASYYIGTNHLWDNGFLPAGNQEGQSISVIVEYSKRGDPDLLIVGSTLRVRQLTTPGTPSGIEHSRSPTTCLRVR